MDDIQKDEKEKRFRSVWMCTEESAVARYLVELIIW